MLKKRIILLCYSLGAILLVFISLQCNTHTPAEDKKTTNASEWQNMGDSAHYVGMNTCRKCHENIYQSFIKTGMGKSFGLATKEKSAADFHHNKPIYDKALDMYYMPYWQDSTLMLMEYRLSGRDTVHIRREKVNYVIGSGHHTNSHIQNINGYLNQAPFTFYVQQGKWDLPPGFENGFNSRFSRILDAECISCHNGYPELVPGSVSKYKNIPLGIDCERCHGPGSLHAKMKMSGLLVDTSKGPDHTIVNPKKLPYPLQIDVCQRCHLQGNTVLNKGKTVFDFCPGMKLSDVEDVYLPVYENQEKGFLMAAHAERLQKSKCFLKTQNNTSGLNCITCHNPHISVKVTGREYFISKCMECHAKPHVKDAEILKTKGSDCITCHMPHSEAVDIPHVSITDHYIRIPNNKAKASAVGIGKFMGLNCVNNARPDDLSKARAYMYFYEKFEHKRYILDSAHFYLLKLDKHKFAEEYIYYAYLDEDYPAVTVVASSEGNVFKEAVTNYQVSQSYINQGNYSKALVYMKPAVSTLPLNLDYRLKMGTIYTALRDFESARKEFAFVKEENSKLPAAWNGLAFLDMALLNPDAKDASIYIESAKKHLAQALALDPDYEPAHINKAKIYIFTNDMAAASKELMMVRKRNPKSKDASQLLQLIQSNRN